MELKTQVKVQLLLCQNSILQRAHTISPTLFQLIMTHWNSITESTKNQYKVFQMFRKYLPFVTRWKLQRWRAVWWILRMDKKSISCCFGYWFSEQQIYHLYLKWIGNDQFLCCSCSSSYCLTKFYPAITLSKKQPVAMLTKIPDIVNLEGVN